MEKATVTVNLEDYLKLTNTDYLKEINELKKQLSELEKINRNQKAELNKTISGLRNDAVYYQNKIAGLSERVKFTTDEANKCFNLHKKSEESELSWKKIAEDAVTKLRKLQAKTRAKK